MPRRDSSLYIDMRNSLEQSISLFIYSIKILPFCKKHRQIHIKKNPFKLKVFNPRIFLILFLHHLNHLHICLRMNDNREIPSKNHQIAATFIKSAIAVWNLTEIFISQSKATIICALDLGFGEPNEERHLIKASQGCLQIKKKLLNLFSYQNWCLK